MLLDELLGIFVEDAPVRMEAIRKAIAGGEVPELAREAHTLKGALKVIGATTAAGLAQGLEALARDGNMSEADKLSTAFEREMDRLMQSLLASSAGETPRERRRPGSGQQNQAIPRGPRRRRRHRYTSATIRVALGDDVGLHFHRLIASTFPHAPRPDRGRTATATTVPPIRPLTWDGVTA